MPKIRVGIIGSGGVAQWGHIPAYKKLKGVEVLAICDPRVEVAEEVAKRNSIPYVFKDYKELLKLKEIRAVSICTPNYLHKEAAVAALSAGKDVLCEKPMATSAKEAEKMVKAAQEAGRILMIGLNNRFRSEVQVLKRLIKEGELGDIYYAKCGWLRRRGIPGLGSWFTEEAKSGGGPLIDLGVHMIDLAWYLMGCPKAHSVTASAYQKFAPQSSSVIYDTEDFSCGIIKFKGQATLFFETSWALNIKEEFLYSEVYGTKGGARLDPLEIYSERNGVLVDIHPKVKPLSGHQEEVRHFIECIKRKKKPISPGEEGWEVMKLLDAIYESAEKGREVIVG